MTYCVGILVREGLVMIADTRTNAGLDNIATFRKLHTFERPGAFIAALATAGNLSISQAILSHLREGLDDPETGERARLVDQTSMFQAAQLVGRAIRRVHETDGPSLAKVGASFDVSILLGGQMKGRDPRLFMLYSAGNFIEATTDTPFLQIGEHKYGKPILDRAVTFETEIYDALKLGLISMDSTMRSNLGVGLPVDISVMRRDALTWETQRRIEAGEPYFHDLRERWSYALRRAHNDIPRPPYGPQAGKR
ncbi:MAG: peptidase [Hyphomicrobiaceae bacterium]